MFEATLESISAKTLTPVVREALKSRSVELSDWIYEPVHGGSGELFDEGLFRFFGNGQDEGQLFHWSMMLKIIRAESELTSYDPSAWDYWKREALAYQSGLLDKIPGDFEIPRCYLVHEQTDGEIWIWLEEIFPKTQGYWPLDRYELAARHIGQFNGEYLVHRKMPSFGWLSNGRIREWLEESEETIPQLQQYMGHPLMARWFSGDLAERTAHLWDQREDLLEAISHLPPTLCHHDAFRRNLIDRKDETGRDTTVAIDWSMLGPGAIGEDIATMFSVTLQFMDIDVKHAPKLDTSVFNGYLGGLHDAGWNGDSNLVRYGFAAGAVLFMGLGGAGSWLPWIVDEDQHVLVEQIIGRPVEEIIEQWSKMQAYMLDLGDEALQLRDMIF